MFLFLLSAKEAFSHYKSEKASNSPKSSSQILTYLLLEEAKRVQDVSWIGVLHQGKKPQGTAKSVPTVLSPSQCTFNRETAPF